MMRMFGSDTRRALRSANSVVEALTDTTSALVEYAKDAARKNDDISGALVIAIGERDQARQLAEEWRDKAFETLIESEIIGNLLGDAEDDLTDTAFNFGVLLVEVQELLKLAPAGRRVAYVEKRDRVTELVRAFDERDRDAVAALLAEYEVVSEDVPEGETPDGDE